MAAMNSRLYGNVLFASVVTQDQNTFSGFNCFGEGDFRFQHVEICLKQQPRKRPGANSAGHTEETRATDSPRRPGVSGGLLGRRSLCSI